ncbi:MAG TPA: hypothetical protein VFJ17_10925 [Mycobacteriales bacterium]|nr:hypothetical protein [Mycobacteriales bacterium]
MHDDLDLAGRPRWHGRPGRLEVHYLTATDQATGTGVWVHHEVVAPTDDDAPVAHGWVAVFPPDRAPVWERFGPVPAPTTYDAPVWARSGDSSLTPRRASGSAGELTWELAWDTGDEPPMWTFPRWAWQRQLLPAAQVVPLPRVRMTGTVAGQPFDGWGGLAHIYGHGNAQRWVWLHADLGDGDVLELVAATARRPGLRVLPPLPLLQLRLDGHDWPRDPLAAAPLMRAAIGDHRFAVTGIVGTRRIRVAASLPADRSVDIGYTDPDGAAATCTNSERADVAVTVARLGARGWRTERSWRLDGTGHAEIGHRP